MENLQARIKAIRALQTDMNLAKQPDVEPPAPHETEVRAEMGRAETNVVEMPERVNSDVNESKPATRSRRKTQTTSKRKSSATTAKPKAAVPFRQLRESQELSLDELRRLQNEAERITQRLVERASETPAPASVAEPDPSEVAMRSSAAIQKKPSKRSPQTHLSYDQGEVPPMPPKDEESENLKIQADRIHQLLAELEATIQQAGTIAQSSTNSGSAPATAEVMPPQAGSPPPKSTRRSNGRKPSAAPSQTQQQASNPESRIEEPLPGYAAKNLKQAVQEAAETAQALRYLANLEHQHLQQSHYHPGAAYPADFGRTRSAPPRRSSANHFGLRLRDLFQVPRKPMDKLGDAMLWIVLSVVVRVGSRFLIATFPAYTPLIIAGMLAPAALAVYLAVFVPRAGFVSVYRLFLIMLGLLLGGKL